MKKTQLNDRRRAGSAVSVQILRSGAAGLLSLSFVASNLGPAQAEPIRNPQNCSGPVTIGVSKCQDTAGHWVECIPSGDYMCCTSNAQGGKDCEQITTLTGPKGGLGTRPSGGVFQNAPVTPAPSTPRVPRAGMNPRIQPRGIEGETPASPTVPEETGK